MSEIERMTITMPAEMAAVVKSAVDAGDYASTSEIVRAALRVVRHGFETPGCACSGGQG